MKLCGSRALFWFVIVYAALLLFLAPCLTLWLDEILTLTGAVQPNLASMMENLRKQQGASPLAFLIPHWTIALLGLSNFTARITSVIPAVASCPAIFLLARRAGLAYPILAVAIFALWPLEFRYALEARPYALALCLGLWLTVAFLAGANAILYISITLAMALTHPYALVFPLAHLVYAFARQRSLARTPAIAIALSVLVLLPWYAHFRDDWRTVSAEQELSPTNWRAPLVFLREISGSGYFGAAILITGIALGLRRIQLRPLWIALALVPLIAIPLANIAFDYFFAVRQVIYALPALALLFTAGTDHPRATRCLAIAFLIASVYADVRWFTRPREDWSAAANAAVTEVNKGACIAYVADAEKLYMFFRPELAAHHCEPGAPRVILAGSTYETATHQSAARAILTSRGLTRQSQQSFEGPTLEIYQ
ncbi:MAG: hypothetical protein WDO18_05315 [Acidobacteriota bacterium]